MRRTVLISVVALLCVTAGVLGLVRADRGLVREHRSAGGLPVELVRPEGAAGKLPGVVVVHGYAGSARLMRGFADTLARRGYVVALPDLTGHGANPRRLPEQGAAWDAAIQVDLRAAVGLLRSSPLVEPDRIALVGHSMGAGAVAEFAAQNAAIRDTVAISLGAEGFGRPQRLLVVYGGLEFPGFRAAARDALRSGAAEKVVEVPGVEHISVLFSGRTHEETADWLGAAAGAVHPRDRVVPGALLLLGAILGLLPLASVLRSRPPGAPERVAWWWAAVAVPVAAVAAKLAAPLPLAVGDYAAGYFLVFGLVLTAAGRRRPRLEPVAVRGLVLVGYAVAAVAVPIHLALTHALPVGDRWWLLPVVTLCCAVFLFGAESASGGCVGRHALILALSAGGLLAAAMVGVAPGFVVLVVPLLVVLLAWQAVWAAVLRRRGAPAWLVALVGAVVLAWPLATALPLAV
ncbi:alpha/beta fold hydrolase [Dactylosporangium sp. AC04546]|uniref:dienelactone hydrolase family protein n=1 Tax=Dactylosporangium sp. AC04546 TaxID=2862460 RepID=UPI001EDD564B|nr:alpha/beta fold hydrolase [Dactylosporangium sp. AC04546]WVK81894.1 alpha/beta fold hydrolase [Dactylosporangium sp. AC04546]